MIKREIEMSPAIEPAKFDAPLREPSNGPRSVVNQPAAAETAGPDLNSAEFRRDLLAHFQAARDKALSELAKD